MDLDLYIIGVQSDDQSSILSLFYIENYVALIFLLDQPFHASMLSAALYGLGFVNCLLCKDLYVAVFLFYKNTRTRNRFVVQDSHLLSFGDNKEKQGNNFILSKTSQVKIIFRGLLM
jgi:hypothetical protein